MKPRNNYSTDAVVQRCSVKKGCSENFWKIHKKTPVTESLISKVAGSLQIFTKQTPAQVFYCKICEIFKNNYFDEFEE